MRIVSLLPSATEMICEIGLGDQLCGVTHECDYPSYVTKLPKVTTSSIPHDATSAEIDRLVSKRTGGPIALYSLDTETLLRLRPDVIVTQALCDVCAVAEGEVLSAVKVLPGKPRVINLSPMSLGDMLGELQQLGESLGYASQARDATASLMLRVEAVKNRSQSMSHHPTTILLEWIDPPFSAGHWSPELVRYAGGQEMLGREGTKSKRIDRSELTQADPEVIVIACCGFSVERSLVDVDLLRSYPGFASLQAVRNQRVYVADGSSYFNRPGPRLVDSLELLAHAIEPSVHPLPSNLQAFVTLP
jgi:iron complex transport system substrate-binding protein